MWVPPEQTDLVVLQAPTRKGVAVFGSVRPEDGHLVVQQSRAFNLE